MLILFWKTNGSFPIRLRSQLWSHMKFNCIYSEIVFCAVMFFSQVFTYALNFGDPPVWAINIKQSSTNTTEGTQFYENLNNYMALKCKKKSNDFFNKHADCKDYFHCRKFLERIPLCNCYRNIMLFSFQSTCFSFHIDGLSVASGNPWW